MRRVVDPHLALGQAREAEAPEVVPEREPAGPDRRPEEAHQADRELGGIPADRHPAPQPDRPEPGQDSGDHRQGRPNSTHQKPPIARSVNGQSFQNIARIGPGPGGNFYKLPRSEAASFFRGSRGTEEFSNQNLFLHRDLWNVQEELASLLWHAKCSSSRSSGQSPGLVPTRPTQGGVNHVSPEQEARSTVPGRRATSGSRS